MQDMYCGWNRAASFRGIHCCRPAESLDRGADVSVAMAVDGDAVTDLWAELVSGI